MSLPTRVQRLVQSADFERVLGAPQKARSPHFAMHFVAAQPARRSPRAEVGHPAVQPAIQPAVETSGDKLSTDVGAVAGAPVDDLPLPVPNGRWLGLVVPKRHARRSVTRTLLKRQIRAVVGEQAEQLPPGLWVVRLRAPFDARQFRSAASQALRDAARAELQKMIRAAASAPR